MPDLTSVVSLDAILALPWFVGIPGLLAIALLVLSAFWSALALRPVRAIARLILAFIVAAILSNGGEAIARLIGGGTPGA